MHSSVSNSFCNIHQFLNSILDLNVTDKRIIIACLPQALVLDMAGVGVTWDNLWTGPGVPFGGSLIMMAIDTVLYGFIAYWLDAVMPSKLWT